MSDTWDIDTGNNDTWSIDTWNIDTYGQKTEKLFSPTRKWPCYVSPEERELRVGKSAKARRAQRNWLAKHKLLSNERKVD